MIDRHLNKYHRDRYDRRRHLLSMHKNHQTKNESSPKCRTIVQEPVGSRKVKKWLKFYLQKVLNTKPLTCHLASTSRWRVTTTSNYKDEMIRSTCLTVSLANRQWLSGLQLTVWFVGWSTNTHIYWKQTLEDKKMQKILSSLPCKQERKKIDNEQIIIMASSRQTDRNKEKWKKIDVNRNRGGRDQTTQTNKSNRQSH